MITIHHLLVSQSERVIWLMEELGLDYKLISYPRDPQTRMADPEFLRLHPLGAAPVIQDGDVTMAESSAIFTYILELYGNGKLRISPHQPGYADFIYWFQYANAGLMPQMMQNMMLARLSSDTGPAASSTMQERFARHLNMLNNKLAKSTYIAGEDFTAADILLQFPFGTMSAFLYTDISGYPEIQRWVNLLSTRPAYQKAMKLAGHDYDPAQRA